MMRKGRTAGGNLLAQYIDDWRKDRIDRRPRPLDGQEQADITDAVIEAANAAVWRSPQADGHGSRGLPDCEGHVHTMKR